MEIVGKERRNGREWKIRFVPMEVKDRTALSTVEDRWTIDQQETTRVVVNEGRIDAEGLKEGIGCMPMDGWNVSMSMTNTAARVSEYETIDPAG